MTVFSPFDQSLWSATAKPAPDMPTLEGDTTADVCVVGAGYSGLTTALALAKAGVDVVVLEAEQAGFGGSGRNAGHCTPTFHHHSVQGIRDLLGPERGARFIELQTTAADRVGRLIRDHQIECEWVQNGYVMAAATPADFRRLEEKVESYNGAGRSTRLISAGEVREMTGMRRQHGGWFHPDGGHLNPLGFSRGLARAVVAAGGRIFVRSPVEGAERKDGRWQARTPGGRVTADKVIFATGAYTRGAWPGLDRTFRIMRVFVAATEPMPELMDRILPTNVTVHDGHGDIFVYKRDGFGRIVASMFPTGRRGRDMRRTHRILTDRLRWQHPEAPEDLKWEKLWFGELDMQRRTIPRLYGLGPGALAVTGLSGRGVPTGCVLGAILSAWALGAPESDLALPVEPLKPQRDYMSYAPQLALRWYALRDRLSELRQGVASPPS